MNASNANDTLIEEIEQLLIRDREKAFPAILAKLYDQTMTVERERLRTNNLEERLNRSIKARTRLICVFPNQASQIRLVSAICMEISDEWETGAIYLDVKEL